MNVIPARTIRVNRRGFLTSSTVAVGTAALAATTPAYSDPWLVRLRAVRAAVRSGDDKWFPEFDTYRAAAKRVAHQHQATFVPFQAMFDEAVKLAAPEHWAGDGVHPSAAGAALMAHFWVKAVGA